MRNTHPADRLAQVRYEIDVLEAEEERLRRHLIEHPEDHDGDFYAARVGEQTRSRIDVPGLTAAVGSDTVDRFTIRSKALAVRLRRLPVAEITSTTRTPGHMSVRSSE